MQSAKSAKELALKQGKFLKNAVRSSVISAVKSVDSSDLKMYIAVHDDVPDHMVPVVVAHAVLKHHILLTDSVYGDTDKETEIYQKWLHNSYKKCIIRVNQKEFSKIDSDVYCTYHYESSVMNADECCLVCNPMHSGDLPNVLKYAKLWKPKELTL